MFKHRRVPLTHFILPVFFAFFLCLVFLPFAIFGRIFRTFSMSSSVHGRALTVLGSRVAGVGTFPAFM